MTDRVTQALADTKVREAAINAFREAAANVQRMGGRLDAQEDAGLDAATPFLTAPLRAKLEELKEDARSFWLIEIAASDGAYWWAARNPDTMDYPTIWPEHFTKNPNKAVRFPSPESAWTVILTFPKEWGRSFKPTDHMWMNPLLPELITKRNDVAALTAKLAEMEAAVALVSLSLNAITCPDLPEEYEDDIPTLLQNLRGHIAAVARARAEERELWDWLDEMHTLHNRVEFLYVVDGYTATYTEQDGERSVLEAHGPTIREALMELKRSFPR